MASVGLLALIDDIASLLDDVAIISKVAAKKTAGILGDDLALNAEQVSGVRAERDLPVVWAVAKGSAINKVILVPCALLISAFLPWLITPLLMIGGAYLCYEGFEKVLHVFNGHSADEQAIRVGKLKVLADSELDLVAFEQEKIKAAIRTDFILSAEIIVIVLGVVQREPLAQQIFVVVMFSAFITVIVYGIVAVIVKLDDIGLYLVNSKSEVVASDIKKTFGAAILVFCPYLMKSLSVIGTLAMFLVGGGILLHGIPMLELWLTHWLTIISPLLFEESQLLLPVTMVLLVGLAVGSLLVMLRLVFNKLKLKSKSNLQS